MSSLQPEDTAVWYADKVRTYGFDHRGLGFGQKSSQTKRFEAMLALGDLDDARILDVGCGFGDFLEFRFGLNRGGVADVHGYPSPPQPVDQIERVAV